MQKRFIYQVIKEDNKTYYRHTGYPGGIKSRTARQILEGPHSDRVDS